MIVVDNVVLLGNSPKFIESIRKIFKKSSIQVVSWRELVEFSGRSVQSPDLILVCGYDYKSNWYSLKRYMDVNVYHPARYIDKIIGDDTVIVYIDTGDEASVVTYSRYRYAKNSLALILCKLGKRFRRIVLPVLLDSEGNANIHGGFITKFIFNTLIKLNLIKTTPLKMLEKLLNDSLKESLFDSPRKLTPKCLKFRRSLFVDRVLRFICG